MVIKNALARRLFRAALIIVCAVGIIIHVAGSADNAMIFWYFTVLSNILVLVFFIYLLISDVRRGKAYEEPLVFKGAVTMCIVLTGLVFNLLLAGTMGGGGIALPGNTFVHILTPILVLVDYLLFSPKGRFTASCPWKWTALPLIYFAALLARWGIVGDAPFGGAGGTASAFPYPFLDIAQLGVQQGALNILGVFVGFIVVGYLLVALDRALGKHAVA